jgi:hypothetical protein
MRTNHHKPLTGKHSKADIESNKFVKSDLSIGGVPGADCPNSLGAETVSEASETLLELTPVHSSRTIPVNTHERGLNKKGT